MSTQRDTFVFPDKQALLNVTLESNNTGFSESPDDDHASAGYITPTERDHQIAARNNILSPTGIDRENRTDSYFTFNFNSHAVTRL